MSSSGRSRTVLFEEVANVLGEHIGSIIDPEDRSRSFVRNTGKHIQDRKASQLRRFYRRYDLKPVVFTSRT
jgi:hypothetical protein